MKIENNSFTLSGNELEHSQKYFDELMAMIELIRHNDKELLAIDFKLRIPIKSVKDWDEMAIENNLYFLEKIKLLDIERTNDSPRKYKIKVNEPSVNSFIRMAENKFVLDSDFSEDEFLAFIIAIKEKIYINLYGNMIDFWKNNIINKYSSSERQKALIIERDKQIKQFDSHTNLLKFYDITNPKKLSKTLKKAVLHKEKIPFSPNPLIGLINPIKKLEYTLELRFNYWYRIQTLNELIELESNSSRPLKKEESTIEKFKTIPKHIKDLFSIYKSEFERLDNDSQKALDSISIKTFEDKERIKYKGTTLKNVKDRIRSDFQKYNLIPKK